MEVWEPSIAVAGPLVDPFPFGYEWFERVDCHFLSYDYRIGCRFGLSFIGHFINSSLLGVWLVLENKQSKADHQRRRHLTITVSEQDSVAEQISPVVGPKLFRN